MSIHPSDQDSSNELTKGLKYKSYPNKLDDFIFHMNIIQLLELFYLNNFNSNKNKAFIGLRSCDNVQTEKPIFEDANWPRPQI